MALGLKRKWTIVCAGGLGVLVMLAGGLAILDRALSKGLAPIGTELPFEVVEANLEDLTVPDDPGESDQALVVPKKGDRLDLTVQRHAILVTDAQMEETPSLGYLVARKNECLIAFPAQSQLRGYRPTTAAAALASWY